MKPLHILLIFTGSAFSLCGQQAFTGLTNGYVFDSVGQSIRAVLGMPGAASLGAPSQPLWDLVSVAPNGKRALGVSGLSVSLIPDLSQPASFTILMQAAGTISRIGWSGDSTTAAIYSAVSRQLERITGLDATPAVHDPIDLTALSATISGWSLSPDGRYLALSSPALGKASIYLPTVTRFRFLLVL